MLKPVNLYGQHAVKLFVSTELKTRLTNLAESLDRPLANVCRHLLWIALPIVEGMQDAHERGSRWWLAGIANEERDIGGSLEENA